MWYLQIQQVNVKHEMAAVIHDPGTFCTSMSLSLSEFQKGRISDHEMYVNGRMYDIRSCSISGDQVQLQVVNDTKEESIIENIKGSVNNRTPGTKGTANQLIKLLTLDYINFPDNQDLSLQETGKVNLQITCTLFHSFSASVTSPPPEFV